MRYTEPKFVTAVVDGVQADDVVRYQLGTPSIGRSGVHAEDGRGSILFSVHDPKERFEFAPDIEIAADELGGLLLCQLRQYDVDIYGDSRCRECGCTDTHGCPRGCSWAEADLCSRCAS